MTITSPGSESSDFVKIPINGWGQNRNWLDLKVLVFPEIESDPEITDDLGLIGNPSLPEEAPICSRHNNSRLETNGSLFKTKCSSD